MRDSHFRPRANGWGPVVTPVIALIIAASATVGAQSPTEYAQSLSIAASPGGVTLTVTDAWPGAPPLVYHLDEDATRGRIHSNEETTLSIPVNRIVSLTTPALAHLADLEALDRVVGVDTAQYVYSQEVRAGVTAGRIAEVGTASQFNVERVIAIDPDVVILSAWAPDDPTIRSLHAAGIPTIVYADWRESTPLGRAEWVRLIGLLIGRDPQARQLFRERETAYNATRWRVQSIVDARPTVMINAPFKGRGPSRGGRATWHASSPTRGATTYGPRPAAPGRYFSISRRYFSPPARRMCGSTSTRGGVP